VWNIHPWTVVFSLLCPILNLERGHSIISIIRTHTLEKMNEEIYFLHPPPWLTVECNETETTEEKEIWTESSGLALELSKEK
jgi:hypothetical protein